jgi:hypothetical protein
MDEQTPEQPKKKRGWPAGKPRGPRKPSAAPPAPTPAPAPFAPPEPTRAVYEAPRTEPPEPVTVDAVTISGKAVAFSASELLVQNGRYVFTSYPAQRGYERVTILRADQLASLSVTGPKFVVEMLKAGPPPTLVPVAQTFPGNDAVAAGMGAGPIVYGPPLQRPPYATGDPRRFVRDTNVERAATIPNAPGIPMAEISKGEDGVPETIRATMG